MFALLENKIEYCPETGKISADVYENFSNSIDRFCISE